MTDEPSIYYWNQRRCLQKAGNRIIYLTPSALRYHGSFRPLVEAQVQVFALGAGKLTYINTDNKLYTMNLETQSTAAFIYRPLRYDEYADFVQDIVNDKILRRKHVELLDVEKTVVKYRYRNGNNYISALCEYRPSNENETLAVLLSSGTELILCDFRAPNASVLLQNLQKISYLSYHGRFLVMGYYNGTIEIRDALTLTLLHETAFTGFASAVPIGQIHFLGQFVFVSAHWEKIKRIDLNTFAEIELSSLQSIYGFAPLSETEIVISGNGSIFHKHF